ncbi:hypothetical protein [Streptomyces albus]|uniref:hypothetical protein n=1 Tax=Streptomyces sp. NRRL F-5639 TaxID=1463867 RepID=UPI0004C8210E|nr:hypothetical protein [Streptomyces sp. NRRL F-5639]KPC94854.1 hypothetical protein ADL27_12170 [Streptomyces sp. NRRL F-6602]
MRKTVVTLAVCALAAAGCGTEDRDRPDGPQRSVKPGGPRWTYDRISEEPAKLTDVLATADDDIWVAGTRVSTGTGKPVASPDDGFLLHHDGKRWERRPMPASLGDSVHEARLDAVDSGGFLLTAGKQDRSAWRMARWDGTRWTPLPGPPPGTAGSRGIVDVRAFAADDIWALRGDSVAYHWDGARWSATELPATVRALDGVASDDLWAVGHRDTRNDRAGGPETEYTQPAAVHWDGRAWKLVRTPEYRFSDPVPPEPGAHLGQVLAVAEDDVRAYGEHTYNHGETDDEPADEQVSLRWNGSRWARQPGARGDCAGRAPVALDGDRGMFLDGNRYLTEDGSCVRVHRPRLPHTDGISRRSQQSLWLTAVEPVPGTDEVLGVGHVQVNQPGNPTGRAVVVRLER